MCTHSTPENKKTLPLSITSSRVYCNQVLRLICGYPYDIFICTVFCLFPVFELSSKNGSSEDYADPAFAPLLPSGLPGGGSDL
jgi:hypothetical protein